MFVKRREQHISGDSQGTTDPAVLWYFPVIAIVVAISAAVV